MSERRNTHTLRKMAIEMIELQSAESQGTTDADFLERVIANIYMWAHVAKGGCIHHKDWENDLVETYKKCREAGIIK